MRTTAAADAAALAGQELSIRLQVARGPAPIQILMGAIVEDVNPYTGRVMHRRADVVTPEPMADETAFQSTDRERVPAAYFVPADQAAAIERLRAHGIQLERLSAPLTLPLEEFAIATSVTTPRAFENHQERDGHGQLDAGGTDGAGRGVSHHDCAAAGAVGPVHLWSRVRNDGLVTLERARRGAEERPRADSPDAELTTAVVGAPPGLSACRGSRAAGDRLDPCRRCTHAFVEEGHFTGRQICAWHR